MIVGMGKEHQIRKLEDAYPATIARIHAWNRTIAEISIWELPKTRNATQAALNTVANAIKSIPGRIELAG